MSYCPRWLNQNIFEQDDIAKMVKCNLKVVIVIFDIEIFFKRPVDELSEEDLVAPVLVDQLKFILK